MKFEYKQFSPSLLEDLHYLFRVSGKKTTFNQIEKKYHTKEFGAQYIGFIAYDCNISLPIGFYGVLPIEAIHFGEKIIIAQSADTITHPKYRKQGIFKILAKKTYSLCQKSSIQFLFGIPNYNSFHGFIKHLGWEDRGRFIKFTKSIKTIPINALVNKAKVLQPLYFIYVRVILRLLCKSDKFLDEKSLSHKFYIPQNQKYDEYKANDLHFKIKIGQVKLILSFKGYMKIGLYEAPDNSFSLNINRLKVLAFLTGSHKIVFQKLERFCDEKIEKDLSGFVKSEGLPFIQKKIDPNRFKDEILNINYYDFDTF